ncbi:hypothetical protein Q7C36_018986 [Tachysurus vachellii]|uniref:Sushi domain-containing protein n=1 Tax=Tachysurus vachellii TaxID=175792 RepID=A0AA88RZK3_TACVA|nr:hypothetical protein Q7C36_018986 [Tachysurus vachellii]
MYCSRSDRMICKEDGWDPPPPQCMAVSSPQCQVKSCGNPGDISHGKYLTPDGIVFGATATAQCDKGYTLVGERTRNCRDDDWDGRDPVCKEVKCEPHTLIGASAVSCSDNGTFSPPPRCSIPDTKLIPVLVNVSSSVPPTEQTAPKSMD